MVVFWKRGFVAASMSEIYAATGLKPGNLYATWADKDALFRAAFNAYAAQFRASLPVNETGLPAIAGWLRLQAKLSTEDPDRKGCLIVNTIAERDAHSPETRALATARLDEIAAFFQHNLILANAPDADARAAALTGAVVAIMTLGRAGAPARMIHDVAEQTIRALATPPIAG